MFVCEREIQKKRGREEHTKTHIPRGKERGRERERKIGRER